MTTSTPSSSWIDSVSYLRTPAGRTFLAIFTSAGPALLYRDIPSHLPGLLIAGTGRRSIGRAYNSLVKGRYEYQRVGDKQKVAELKRLMTGVL